MNELTRSLIHEAWPRARSEFKRLEMEVRTCYYLTLGAIYADDYLPRAEHLAQLFCSQCFDLDTPDICTPCGAFHDNCSIELARRMSDWLYYWLVPRRPELQLDEFTQADVERMGYQLTDKQGCAVNQMRLFRTRKTTLDPAPRGVTQLTTRRYTMIMIGDLKETLRDTPRMTVEEKRHILLDWAQFLESEFAWEQFTDGLYQYLCEECGFQPLYNRQGFWAHYFRPNERETYTRMFIQRFDLDDETYHGGPGKSWGFTPDLRDLNDALCAEMSDRAARLRARVNEREANLYLGLTRNFARKLGYVLVPIDIAVQHGIT